MTDKEELTELTVIMRTAYSMVSASAEEEDELAGQFDDWLKRVRAEAADEASTQGQKVIDEYVKKLIGRVLDVFEAAEDEEPIEDMMPRILTALGVSQSYRGFTPVEGTN